jgi:hypothetical protein
MTPSQIEPATFWLVAQCLNQLRHRVPPLMRCGWCNIENEVYFCVRLWPHYCTKAHSSDFIRCAKTSSTYLFCSDGYNIEDLALKRMRRAQTEPTPIHFLSSGSSNIYKRRTLRFNHRKWENADEIKGSTNGEDMNALGNKLLPTWCQTKTDKGILGFIYIYIYITRKVTSKFILE